MKTFLDYMAEFLKTQAIKAYVRSMETEDLEGNLISYENIEFHMRDKRFKHRVEWLDIVDAEIINEYYINIHCFAARIILADGATYEIDYDDAIELRLKEEK